MLTLRKIELHNGACGQPKVLITREMLADCVQSAQLLGSAQTQAEELLRQAAEHREEMLEQARLDFWSRAHAQLSAWSANASQCVTASNTTQHPLPTEPSTAC